MDNELRTSFTLFSEEVVTQDVVDGVSMSVNDGTNSPDASLRLAPPPHSPRQSRSCPCSPKLTGRNHSPKSNTNSPKPRSRSERSRFSLSSSLMAIHRQASNTLRPDFLKFDSSRGDSGGTGSKSGSQHNSLKNESKHSRTSIEALQNNLGESFLNFSHSGSLRGEGGASESSRNPLQESHSLPALKLSRMALTHKGGSASQDKENTPNTSCDKTKLLSEGACALPSMPENDYLLDTPSSPSLLLPDLIPRSESSCLNSTPECDPSTSGASMLFKEQKHGYFVDSKEGVINLGFDGHEESSDFTDLNEIIQSKVSEMESNSPLHSSRRGSFDSDIDLGKSNVQVSMSDVHAISVGHVSQGHEVAMSLDVPQTSGSFTDVDQSSEYPFFKYCSFIILSLKIKLKYNVYLNKVSRLVLFFPNTLYCKYFIRRIHFYLTYLKVRECSFKVIRPRHRPQVVHPPQLLPVRRCLSVKGQWIDSLRICSFQALKSPKRKKCHTITCKKLVRWFSGGRK